MTIAAQRAAVQFLVERGLSTRRACALLQLHRSTFQYLAHPPDDTVVVAQIQALAARYPRYGYRRISALVNQTQPVNQKRVRRLWHK
jgi:hypothetical protein